MKKKCELLAPAGGLRQLRAAVENGADAVYLGGKRFNARINADNFTDEEMSDGVNYAHIRGVKVYVTMNTLLREEELEPALEYAKLLYEMGVDALILQDLGLASLIGRAIPHMPLHLSTQGTVYNLSGVRAAAELGFQRVVLAREMSLGEIKAIAAEEATEIEVFVHGALCLCYSGQCQMSRVLGGRSGNRGACAQPCRLPYLSDGAGTYPLSPKDLCAVDYLGELVDVGVTSLKIEGRMKSAEYVAIVTGIYRKYLDLYLSQGAYAVSGEDREALEQIFNRGGFTEGYLLGNPGHRLMSGDVPKHQGVLIGRVAGIPGDRQLIDVELTKPLRLGDGVEIRNPEMPGNVVTYLKPLKAGIVRIGDIKGRVQVGNPVYRITDSDLIKRARLTFEDGGGAEKYTRRLPVDARFYAEIGKPCRLVLRETGQWGSCEADIAEPSLVAEVAAARPITREMIEKQLRKTGDIPFQVRRIEISMEEGSFLPLSAVNGLRRAAFTALMEQKARVRRPALPSGAVRVCPSSGKTDKASGADGFGEPLTELYFYRAVDSLTDTALRLPDRLVRAGVETGTLFLCLPLRPLLTDDSLPGEIRRGWPRAKLRPYLGNITKGSMDTWIAAHFDEIAEFCREDGLLIGNLGWIREFAGRGVPVYADYGLNLHSGAACATARRMGVRPDAASLESARVDLGPIPLMVSEHLTEARALEDRKGVRYPLLTDENNGKRLLLSGRREPDLKAAGEQGRGPLRIYVLPNGH